MSDALDVMGMSHANLNEVEAFHRVEPDKPLVMTECCSCCNQVPVTPSTELVS